MKEAKVTQIRCPKCGYVFYIKTSNKTQVSVVCPNCKTYFKFHLGGKK